MQMTIKVKKGYVEMLQAFLNQCEGEVVAIKRRRNNTGSRMNVTTSNALQPEADPPVPETMEATSAAVLPSHDDASCQEASMCLYCRQTPCVTTESRDHLGFRAAHIQNHVRRRKDYKKYWSALKKCGLWKDPVYLARKVELGDHVDAVRERMPKCVIKDVRSRFPNPPGIPYMGHKRE